MGLTARYNRLLQVAVPNKNQVCKGEEQVYVCVQPEHAK
jgi:hypothetical protein